MYIPFTPRALPALLISSLALLVGSATQASAAVPDPERNATTPTGWHWWYGLSAAQVEQRYTQDGDRITDVEVQGTSPLRFAVATVRNTGVYARGWYWYYGLTGTQLKAKIAEKNARLIDLETYESGGQRRFAAVMVVNSKDAAKNWHWYYGVSRDTLAGHLDEHNSRLIDLESYSSGGQTRYAAIMIRNSGVDKKGWWWWRNVPLSTVRNQAAANGARTFSLDRLSNGRYNALQVKRAGEFSAYEIDIDARRVGDFVSQNGGRIVDFDSYVVGGQRRFTAIINDNVDGFSARVRNEARKVAKLRDARWGAWVKQIGGPVSIGLGGDRVFEPASTMKTLHHLYLHTRLEADPAEDLNAIVPFATCPATGGTGECASGKAVKDICPTRTGVTATGTSTLDNADRQMMGISDNRMTRAIEQRYGRAVLNLFAPSIGAMSTEINHDLGCFGPTLNEITLADLSVMHEGATNGTILKTAAVRDRFYSTMNGPGISAGVKSVLVAEAAAAGKSAIVDAFVAAIENRGKGGSYGGGGRSVRAGFGRMLIPFKVGGVVQPRAFTYGHFYNCDDCSGNQAVLDAYGKFADEKWRSVFRQALATW